MSPEDSSKVGRLLGHRSLFSWVFGTFFSDSTNTSGLLALGLVAAVIYIQIKNGTVPDRLLDAVFIIVGFYFGGAKAKAEAEADVRRNDRALP